MKKLSRQMETDRRERGWAWVVLASAFLIQIVGGIPLAVGVYVSELIEENILDIPEIALFGSLQIGSFYMSCLASYLTKKVSHRVLLFIFSIIGATSTVTSIYVKATPLLYLTLGVIPGFSAGVLSLQSMVIVNRYFLKRSNFANCLTLSGTATGTIVLPPLFRSIISIYCWRPSLLIVSGIFLQGCALSMCMKPIHISDKFSSADTDKEGYRQSYPCGSSLFGSPILYLFLIANALWAFTISVVFVLLPNLLHETRILGWEINLLLSLIGIMNLLSKIMAAFVFHVLTIDQIVSHIIGSITIAIALVLFVANPSLATLFIASLLFGVSFGLTCCTQSTVSQVIGGVRHYNLIYSLVYGVCVIGASVGPPVSGLLYNQSKSYETTFLSTAGIILISAGIMTVAYILQRKVKTSQSYIVVDANKPLRLNVNEE